MSKIYLKDSESLVEKLRKSLVQAILIYTFAEFFWYHEKFSDEDVVFFLRKYVVSVFLACNLGSDINGYPQKVIAPEQLVFFFKKLM